MGRPPKTDLPPELSKTLRKISANLKYFRQQKGLTQAELARRTKMSTTTISYTESQALHDTRLSTLVAIANVLEIDVIQLFQGSELKMNDNEGEKLLKAGEEIVHMAKKIVKRDKK